MINGLGGLTVRTLKSIKTPEIVESGCFLADEYQQQSLVIAQC